MDVFDIIFLFNVSSNFNFWQGLQLNPGVNKAYYNILYAQITLFALFFMTILLNVFGTKIIPLKQCYEINHKEYPFLSLCIGTIIDCLIKLRIYFVGN